MDIMTTQLAIAFNVHINVQHVLMVPLVILVLVTEKLLIARNK